MERVVNFLKEAETYYFGNSGRRSAKGKTFWNSTYF